MLNSTVAELVSILKYDPTNPKMILLRSRLEEEGIPSFIKNEYGVYRRGSRSPELQIWETDLQKAMVIISEMGFDFETSYDQNPIIEKLDLFASKIPLLNSLPAETRAFSSLTLLAVILTLLLSLCALLF